jgi:hypothetical protein
MTLLSRDAVLGADDRKTEDVPVPEWNGTVRVRALSGTERDAYEAGIVQLRGDGSKVVNLKNLRGRLVSLSCVDEDGARIFTDEDAIALGDKSAAALERVFDVARRLSGLSEDDVKELAEGFESAPSAGSTSA